MFTAHIIEWIAYVLIASSPLLALLYYAYFYGQVPEEEPWLEEHISDALHVANS